MAFFLTPDSRTPCSDGEDSSWRSGLLIWSRRGSQLTAETSRTQHSCGLRRPDLAGSGGCAGNGVPAGPDTPSFPGSWPFEKRRAPLPSQEGPVRHGSRRGRVVSDFFLFEGCGLAGVGGTTGMTFGSSPYQVRQRHADLVRGPRPAGGPRPGRATAVKNRARPASHQTVGLPGLRPRTPARDSWSSDIGVSSLRLAPWVPVRPRLAGRPVAQWRRKRLMSKTSLVCSMG
jgi:hypothetical protein